MDRAPFLVVRLAVPAAVPVGENSPGPFHNSWHTTARNNLWVITSWVDNRLATFPSIVKQVPSAPIKTGA